MRNLSISKYRAGHAQSAEAARRRRFGRTGRMYSIRQKCRGRDRGQGNRRAINRFLETLDAESRKIFVRRYFWAEPVKELAGNLNISEGKVKSQLFRMRAKLKMHLERRDCTVKKNEKFFDAIGQIDERYIAEALEPMYQESVGLWMKIKRRCPKKGKIFLPTAAHSGGSSCSRYLHWRSRNCTVAAAFEEPGPEMAAYDMEGLECGGWNRTAGRRCGGCYPDAGENQGRQPTRMRYRDV